MPVPILKQRDYLIASIQAALNDEDLKKTPGGAGGAGGRVPLARGALLREPSLAGLPLTPTVHVPMWRGTPATIELMGRVPTPELKDTVLRIVRDEAARIRSDVQIEDRLSVVPTMARVA